MIDELHNAIFECVFTENNHKIVKDESLEDYLKSFKNYELTRLAISHVWIDDNYKDLYKIHNLNNKAKKYIIDYITSNLKSVLEAYLKILDANTYNYLKKFISKNGNVKYAVEDFKLPLHFILFLKNFVFAKVHYNKKENYIHIYTPKEIVEILKNAFNDKDIISINKRNNEIADYTKGILEAYGIIPLMKLHEIFEKQMFEIDINELNKVLGAVALIDEKIKLHNYNDDMLVCDIEFDDEDEAIYFYENMKGEYLLYKKEEFEQFRKLEYVKNLNSYKRLERYLINKYDDIEYALDNIYILVILEYITVAQSSVELADKQFMKQIEDILEVTTAEKNRMLLMMKDIFREYPKWKKRGNK